MANFLTFDLLIKFCTLCSARALCTHHPSQACYILQRSSKERRQGPGKRLLYYTVCLHCYIQKEQQRKKTRPGKEAAVLYCMFTLLYTKGAAKKEDKARERGCCTILYAYIVIYKRSSKERRQGPGKRLLYYTVCLHCYIQKEQQRKKTRPGKEAAVLYCMFTSHCYIQALLQRSSKERSEGPRKEATVL